LRWKRFLGIQGKLHSTAEHERLALSVITYYALIRVLETARASRGDTQGDAAARHSAYAISHSALISTLKKAMQPEQALEICKEMQQHIIIPNVTANKVLISASETGTQHEQVPGDIQGPAAAWQTTQCIFPGLPHK